MTQPPSARRALWAQPLRARSADAFWAAIDPALDAIPTDWSKHLNGVGTRASVASSFLFQAEPVKFPFDRPGYGGKAIAYLYDRQAGLDQSSPGALLHTDMFRCGFLLRAFRDARVPLQDMVD